jgi:hypothetical protein
VVRPALQAFLDEAPDSQLVIRHGPDAEPGRHERVAVVVRDRAALRALKVPKGVRTDALAIWLDDATAALSLTPRPEWPPLVLIRSRRVDDGWLAVLRFASPAPVHAVVRELGRQSVWPDRVGERGLVLTSPPSEKVPADVVVADWYLGRGGEDSVAGREPLFVQTSEAPLGPLDERVLNPVGFDRDATEPVGKIDLRDAFPGATESLVRSLRGMAGVAVTGTVDAPEQAARLLGGLAMAGVPLTASALDPVVAGLLGATLTAAITSAVDLTDTLAREEHSIVLRRAALSELSSFAWRRKLGELVGVRVHSQPSVSVVMATRRPEMLEHALAQVSRQRGVDRLELVLAPHGFEPDPGRVAEAAPGLAVQVVPMPEDALFGDVLQDATLRTSGDVVLKMDDDDWYAPDFVIDLLHARAYSGAELVGTPDEFYYVEPRDLTVRLPQPSEVYRQYVAGGTMLLDRTLLQEVGGFRSVRRHVDAQLIHAVRAAGGAIYRAHGLGYCLRRTTTGHTWEADLDDLEARAAATWRGFRPSRLMEL